MDIRTLSSVKVNYNLDVNFKIENYTIRYANRVEDYSDTRRIYYTSESPQSLESNYRIRYESSADNDSLDYKIRYEAFAELFNYSENYRISYENESLEAQSLRYRVRYESEGLAINTVKKIYRVFFESDGVTNKDSSYRIKYTTEKPLNYSLDYSIKYQVSRNKLVQLSYTLLKNQNTTDLVVGIYYAKEYDYKIDYMLFNNLPSSSMYEIEEGKNNDRYYMYTGSDLNYIDYDFSNYYHTFTRHSYMIIKDVDVDKAISLDLYETKYTSQVMNEARSYLFDIQPINWVQTSLTINGTNYTSYNNTYINDRVYLNYTEKELEVEITKDSSVCCYGSNIKGGNNSCSP